MNDYTVEKFAALTWIIKNLVAWETLKIMIVQQIIHMKIDIA
jgi:hypothetical protein